MNYFPSNTALTEPADLLLAEIALRIQLSPTQHDLAVQRYEAIHNWLERPGSLVAGRIVRLYPQGSMSIGATIFSNTDDEDYDIDVIVELDAPADMPPQEILDALYYSVKGEKGSRYYHMTERRTRCVTIHCADMHLDLTPMVLVPEREALTSWVYHHKPDAPKEPTYRTLANPFGFANWYQENTPLDHAFTEAFTGLARSMAGYEAFAKADAEPVPDHEPIVHKSKALVVHQLTKRWRNKQFEGRAGRRPPSPLLARLNADTANQTETLSEELELQAHHLLARFRQAHGLGQILTVLNPTCPDDNFSDRWPGTLDAQAQFIHDLTNFAAKATRLRQEDCGLPEMRQILADLFGEKATGGAFDAFNEALGRTVRSGHTVTDQSGRLDFGRSGIAAVAPTVLSTSKANAAPKHTFYGGNWD